MLLGLAKRLVVAVGKRAVRLPLMLIKLAIALVVLAVSLAPQTRAAAPPHRAVARDAAAGLARAEEGAGTGEGFAAAAPSPGRAGRAALEWVFTSVRRWHPMQTHTKMPRACPTTVIARMRE